MLARLQTGIALTLLGCALAWLLYTLPDGHWLQAVLEDSANPGDACRSGAAGAGGPARACHGCLREEGRVVKDPAGADNRSRTFKPIGES